jgi:hypothetical protein
MFWSPANEGTFITLVRPEPIHGRHLPSLTELDA